MTQKSSLIFKLAAATVVPIALQGCGLATGVAKIEQGADAITSFGVTPMPTVLEIEQDYDGAIAQCEQTKKDTKRRYPLVMTFGIVGCGAVGSLLGPGGLTSGAGGCGIALDASYERKTGACPSMLEHIVERAEQNVTSGAPKVLQP